MSTNEQQIIRERLEAFFDRSDQGVINEFCDEIEMTRQGVGKWRTGKTKRLKPENMAKVKQALRKRGELELDELAPIGSDLILKKNKALLGLADAFESLIVELRGSAPPERKARRLRFELDALTDFLAENFGEKDKNLA
jgi:hypothetical protein